MEFQKKKNMLLKICNIVAITIVFVFSLYRCFFDAELTDEAYSVAENYLIARGGIPIVNCWSQMPGFTLLTAPFTFLFYIITGGTEGIVLATRLIDDGIIVLTMIAVYFIIKKYVVSKKAALMYVVPFFTITGGGVIAFRGDNIAILLLAIGSAMLAVAFVDDSKMKSLSAMSGVFYALSVLCYPTNAIQVFIILILLLAFDIKEKKLIKRTSWFLVGASVAAVVCTGYLIARSSVRDLLFGMKCILNDVTYFQINNSGIVKLPGYLKSLISAALELIRYYAVIFVLIVVVKLVAQLVKRIKRSEDGECFSLDISSFGFIKENSITFKIETIKKMLLLSVIIGTILDIASVVKRYNSTDSDDITLYTIVIMYMAAPFFLCFIKKNRKFVQYLFLFAWIIPIVWMILTGVSTYAGIWGRNKLLRGSAYLSVLYAFIAFDEVLSNSEIKGTVSKLVDFIVSALPLGLFVSVTFACVFNGFSYIYRDVSLLQMNTKIESGPYKGVRTSKERADGLIELEKVVRAYTSEEDYLLAMDNDPFIYLMSDAIPCTPCTWDQALYSYGFDQPDLYYDYFKTTGQEPTVIIYSDYGRDEIMSIETEYKFNDFVHEKYDLVFDSEDTMFYRTIIFTRKNGIEEEE